MNRCENCDCEMSDDEIEICDGCRYTVAEFDDDYASLPKHPCPICAGEGELLGTLGTFDHFRCRACGITYHETKETNND